jgi:hypothetical protein
MENYTNIKQIISEFDGKITIINNRINERLNKLKTDISNYIYSKNSGCSFRVERGNDVVYITLSYESTIRQSIINNNLSIKFRPNDITILVSQYNIINGDSNHLVFLNLLTKITDDIVNKKELFEIMNIAASDIESLNIEYRNVMIERDKYKNDFDLLEKDRILNFMLGVGKVTLNSSIRFSRSLRYRAIEVIKVNPKNVKIKVFKYSFEEGNIKNIQIDDAKKLISEFYNQKIREDVGFARQDKLEMLLS